jgi:serine/threonine protein kinase
MARVWRAEDELLGRDVAIKEVLLPPRLSEAEKDSLCQRMLRAARSAARLSHPAVATVHDVVEDLGRPWIVMELVYGRSLDQVIAEDGPLPPSAVAQIGRQLLAALAAATRMLEKVAAAEAEAPGRRNPRRRRPPRPPATFRHRLPRKESYSLHVGCGGSSSSWQVASSGF